MKRSLLVLLACGLWATVPVTLAVGCGGDDSDDSGDDHGDHGDHDDDHGSEEETEHGDHDHDKDIGPKTGATCPDQANPTYTYENFGEKFITDYCARCHASKVTGAARMGAPADHTFDNLAQIELLAKHIDEYAGSGPDATNTKMPPSGTKPSDADRKKLSEWIACGVPE